ncbi:MAG: NADH-dependent [FeFe] hydrogenase, group A6 [Puniceicoccaceae bacterium]
MGEPPDRQTGGGTSETLSVTIDGKGLEVEPGTTILAACKTLGIDLPTLCYHSDLCAIGVCRMCIVEIEGMKTLQSACTFPITANISIQTHSAKVRTARRHIIDLLLSEHVGECYSCHRNHNCELQDLAGEYGVDFFRFGHRTEATADIDRSSVSIIRDNNKCILCQRCVRTCQELQKVGALETVNRGINLGISTYLDKPLGNVVCINCGQCINRCPTGALRANDNTDDVWAAIDDPEKHVVIQTAPSPRAAICEEFGMEPGHALTWELNTALRRCGFDRVFDTNFTADLTIIEEGTELLLRLYKSLVQQDTSMPLPQFTSCSPGWVKYVEHFFPEFLDNMSSAKSPQQMFGSLIKTFYAERIGTDPANIVSVAMMPCTAKKFECSRSEMCSSGFRDVDYGLTTREVAQMISEAGIHLPDLPKSDFDDPFGSATGSGVIFGATGGVMEAALRTVLELVTGERVENFYDHADIIPIRGFDGCRLAEVTIPAKVGPVPELIAHLVPDWKWLAGAVLKVGIAHGTANAHKVMEDIKSGGPFSECHFIEIMACPGGCLGGGGMPIPTSQDIRQARANAIYEEDHAYEVRKSHENPAVNRIYSEFLKDGPCGPLSHKLLHTHYTARGKFIG